MAEPLTQPRPHRRRVPRWVWFVAVCVALGAMTSVGVAWGIAWRNPLGFSGLPEAESYGRVGDLPPDVVWYVTSSSAHAGEIHTSYRFSDITDREKIADWRREQGTNAETHFKSLTAGRANQRAMIRHAPLVARADRFNVGFTVSIFGWPWPCVGREFAFSSEDAAKMKAFRDNALPESPPVVLDPVFNLRPYYGAVRVGRAHIPVFPLWPGLLANTAFYGGAWAVLIGATVLPTRWFVRRRRARRGGCPQCGYSREGLKAEAPCPECGRTPAASTRPEGPRDRSPE